MLTVREKIEILRGLMKENQLDACIIPSSDPHISEYPADCWKYREYISGFTGSAGTVVITLNKAGLWTDSRYFLQAEDQLHNSGIDLFKERLPETPTITEWLSRELSENTAIGMDGDVFPASGIISSKKEFLQKNISIQPDFKLLNSIWKNRPSFPSEKAFILPEELSGKSSREKIKHVLEDINREGADTTVIASLDTIAWLFNIRGNDVRFNPVVTAYAILSESENVLFIQPEKLTQECIDYFKEQNIVVADYNKITDYIRRLPDNRKILINPHKINYSLFKAISEKHTIINTDIHPADLLKSIKNDTEINGFRNAMLKDGIALVKFFMWLEQSLEKDETVTELDISQKLREYRSEQQLYFGESFETIAGYASHGAIIHYAATKESNAEINREGLLLIDSGAQYFDGTTDITRTIAVGSVTEEMKRDYTLVLKGHIALILAQFPEGTKGIQLDILARKPLWENGVNYLYGTGHGIGHFLNVHEGPQSIRMEYNPVPIVEGMITSNEPGIYRKNKYGIRTENLMLTVKKQTTEYGTFLGFETLTLCPIDTTPVDLTLLNKEEVEWIDSYHQQVYDRLSPFLTEEENNWLKNKTKKLNYEL